MKRHRAVCTVVATLVLLTADGAVWAQAMGTSPSRLPSSQTPSAQAGLQGNSGEPDLAFEMVRLGHIEAGQALSLLQALGYE